MVTYALLKLKLFLSFYFALKALTANTEDTSTLVNLAWAESVEAGGSKRRWRAHPAPSAQR
eukprot:scaffold18613_cov112-Isochrysis_galbana.AAC.1